MAAKLLLIFCMTLGVTIAGIYDGYGYDGYPYGGYGYGHGGYGGYGYGHGGYGGYGYGHGGYALGGYAAPAAISVAKVATPVAVAAPVKKVIDYVDPHPAYKFEYAVHDPHTGDVKQQSESREGDVVHGSYSLVEPDGSKRVVEYTADPHNGFNAVVHRTPNAHPAVVKKIAIAAAPIAIKAPIYSQYAPYAHY